MKAEIYNAHAAMNRGCGAMLEFLAIPKEQEVITADYVQQQLEILEEIRAGMNT